MNSATAKEVGRHLLAIRGWIKHWQRDQESNLVPTADSLLVGRTHADAALSLVLDHWFKGKQIAKAAQPSAARQCVDSLEAGEQCDICGASAREQQPSA
jgi:hypothetical protein